MQELMPLLTFRYRGLFQSAEIRFFKKNLESGHKIICEGDVRLPLLKKSYAMNTNFTDDLFSWSSHTPAFEKGATNQPIDRQEAHAEVLDPIGFFLLLDEDLWTKDSVNLLIGNKTVTLDVVSDPSGSRSNSVEIRRRGKDQKLIVHREKNRISKIEIPVPVIGSLCLERVGMERAHV